MSIEPKINPSLIIQPHKNRLKQVGRNGRAKRFDAERRRIFLEWFASTCNVKLAAEQAGIDRTCAYRHRRMDASFAEAWDEALAQGYASLEAGLVADAIASELGPCGNEAISDGSAPPAESPLSFDQRMALLREYRRADGSRGPRPVRHSTSILPRVASPAEAEAALINRLKHFAMRVTDADAEGRTVLDPPRAAKSGIPITKRSGGKTRGK